MLDLGRAYLFAAGGGCSYDVVMLTMEAVGNERGRRVEGFVSGGQDERNGWHRGDNR